MATTDLFSVSKSLAFYCICKCINVDSTCKKLCGICPTYFTQQNALKLQLIHVVTVQVLMAAFVLSWPGSFCNRGHMAP